MRSFFEDVIFEVGKKHNCLVRDKVFYNYFEEVCEVIASKNGWVKHADIEDWEDVCYRNSFEFNQWVDEFYEDW